MTQLHRFLVLARLRFDRAFLLVFPGLLLAAAPMHAQIANTADTPTCVRRANTEIAESLLLANPAGECPAKTSDQPSTPSSPAAPGVAPASATPEIAPASAVPGQPEIAPINHRLFGVVANYTTVETQDQYGTLSAKTKFKLSLKTMTDATTISFLGGLALLGQARNTDPTYGQGFFGYDKRFATIYANTGIGTLMTTSVFPTVLHQDPRYFQLGTGGFRHRMVHAVSSIFLAHSDAGAVQFNYSQLAGNAVAAGISNTYLPESQRTLGNTAHVWASDTLLNMLCNVAKEFWPDVRAKLHRH